MFQQSAAKRVILCPTDFSEFSRYAIEHAVAIAAVFRASVTVYHVVPQTLMHPELFPYVKEPVLVPPDIVDRARERLESFVAEIDAGAVEVEARLESGDAAPRILELASELEAHLLALGSHGRGGVRRWLLGSVTEHVLRGAGCPVLTVGSPPRPFPLGESLPYERVLAAVDFSEGSLRALEEAAGLIEASRTARLVLVHVLEPSVDEEVASPEVARARLQRLVADCLAGIERVEIVVVSRGQPDREIRREAEERDVDLVIAGASGRGSLDDLLFGSTVSQIVRTVGCAVLSVGPARSA